MATAELMILGNKNISEKSATVDHKCNSLPVHIVLGIRAFEVPNLI